MCPVKTRPVDPSSGSPTRSAAPSPRARRSPGSGSHRRGTWWLCSTRPSTPCCARCGCRSMRSVGIRPRARDSRSPAACRLVSSSGQPMNRGSIWLRVPRGDGTLEFRAAAAFSVAGTPRAGAAVGKDSELIPRPRCRATAPNGPVDITHGVGRVSRSRARGGAGFLAAPTDGDRYCAGASANGRRPIVAVVVDDVSDPRSSLRLSIVRRVWRQTGLLSPYGPNPWHGAGWRRSRTPDIAFRRVSSPA